MLAAGVTSVYGMPRDQTEKSDKSEKGADLFGIGIAGFTFLMVPP